jgi:hypothetical protein
MFEELTLGFVGGLVVHQAPALGAGSMGDIVKRTLTPDVVSTRVSILQQGCATCGCFELATTCVRRGPSDASPCFAFVYRIDECRLWATVQTCTQTPSSQELLITHANREACLACASLMAFSLIVALAVPFSAVNARQLHVGQDDHFSEQTCSTLLPAMVCMDAAHHRSRVRYCQVRQRGMSTCSGAGSSRFKWPVCCSTFSKQSLASSYLVPW